MQLSEQLPNIYENFLPPELLKFSPQETLATCQSCAMAKEHGNTKKPFYKPNLKCCTFEPFLPNFLVGAILKDSGLPFAHEIIRGKIQNSEFVLPIGLVAPVAYQLRFHEKKDQIFGQKSEYLCSFFEKTLGTCEIWQYRGNVCTSFICQSSYGAAGIEFWNHMRDLLSLTEQVLMEEVLVQLDFSPRQVSEMFSFINVVEEPLAMKQSAQKELRQKWSLSSDEMKNYWNGYPDPEAFYLKSYALAEKMSHNEFYEMIGETGQSVFDKALQSLQKIKA